VFGGDGRLFAEFNEPPPPQGIKPHPPPSCGGRIGGLSLLQIFTASQNISSSSATTTNIIIIRNPKISRHLYAMKFSLAIKRVNNNAADQGSLRNVGFLLRIDAFDRSIIFDFCENESMQNRFCMRGILFFRL
jgi:hypothetical protein